MPNDQTHNNTNKPIHTNGRHDLITHRMVVSFLGGTAILCGIGMIVLPLYHINIPPSVPAFGGTALGALAGMLASIMKGNEK